MIDRNRYPVLKVIVLPYEGDGIQMVITVEYTNFSLFQLFLRLLI